VTAPRVVARETLDHLAADDPAALRSRRDLVRVHRAMGTAALLRRGWQALLAPGAPGRARLPLRVLELGAGDGSLLLGLARRWPAHAGPVQLCLLDRQDIVSPATLGAYAALGWSARTQVVDVLDWAARPEAMAGDADGTAAPRWDLITTALFLHHFSTPELEALLAAVAARCDRFFACEPRRSWPALAGSRLVGAIGANAVTREDAVLSVKAGFRDGEIAMHWPKGGPRWQLHETAAGLFSHCFSARRMGQHEPGTSIGATYDAPPMRHGE
jgi:hypothetical protein